MQQLLDILSAAEAAGDLTEALCHSTHAVIEALGDAADEYLAVQVPAYGALRAVCSLSNDCINALRDTRTDILMDIAKATGLYYIVSAMVETCKRLPPVLRTTAGRLTRDALERVRRAREIATALLDLDMEATWNSILNGESFLSQQSALSIDWHEAAGDVLKALGIRVETYLGPLEDIPLFGDIVKGALDLASFTSSALANPTEFLSSGASALGIPIPSLSIPSLGDVEDAVNDTLGGINDGLDLVFG